MTRRPPRSTRTGHTLSLHDALPISAGCADAGRGCMAATFAGPRPLAALAGQPRHGGAECPGGTAAGTRRGDRRSEEHTSELQSLLRISYAVFCLKKKKTSKTRHLKSKRRDRRTQSTNIQRKK